MKAAGPRIAKVTLALGATVLVGLAALGGYVRHGGMSARRAPPRLEAWAAGRLLDWSIPAADRDRPNPLAASPAELAAGRALYARHCETCHGTDGDGLTLAGTGAYPPPPRLRDERTQARTDGALFHLLREGVRNTAMPAWRLPDDDLWRLVLAVRHLPATADALPTSPSVDTRDYVGSAACAGCHREIHDRWRTTLMANVVRDPRVQPQAILPDLSRPNPLVTFTAADVALTYGTRWKQRYFARVDGDFYAYPAQWDVTHHAWKPYAVKDDWWVPFYPGDNFTRPTSALCDGCHSVAYDVATRTPKEWNVGCEQCHGPGGPHARDPRAPIVNPVGLDPVAANDTCIQCHSQGRPLANPIDGKYYDWPVGFRVGLRLRDFWRLEGHEPGATTFTHFADGTAHKNRMQGNDYVQSQMYTHGVTCSTCHDPHGSPNDAMLRKPGDGVCLDCHAAGSANGPRAPTLAAHTHHAEGSAGASCVACHMPKIAQTIGDVNVRSHTFRFVPPGSTGVPNACTTCHADRPATWAVDAMRTWSERSPWRVE